MIHVLYAIPQKVLYNWFSENRLLSQDCVPQGSFDKLFENKILEPLFRVDANETKRRFRRKTLNPAMFSSSSYRWADPDDID